MIAINDYLKKLLYQYDCVVVPELGAFLTHYQSATFTEADGEYQPPRKRVAFNEALRFDDGILANYVMLQEDVTRETAQRHIGQFVSELRQQVGADSYFTLDGIGAFMLNEEEKLQFVPSLRHNFFADSYGFTSIKAQLLHKELITEPSLPAIPVQALGPVLVRDEEAILTPYRPTRPYWYAAAVALIVGSLGTISYFTINPGGPLQSSLDPGSLLQVPASYLKQWSAPTPEKLVPAPVAAVEPIVEEPTPASAPSAEPIAVKTPPAAKTLPAASVTGIVKPTVTAAKPVVVAKPIGSATPITPSATKPVAALPAVAKAKPAPVPVVKKEESVVAVTAPTVDEKSAVVEPEAVVAPAKPVRTGPLFIAIAGVFSSKQNAMGLMKRLNAAGYDASVMPEGGKKKVYKVGAISSAVREELVGKLSAIDAITGAETWIMKK